MSRYLCGWLVVVVVATLVGVPAPAAVFVVPDDPGKPGATFVLPWDLVEFRDGAFSTQVTLPDLANVDALHRMDGEGLWLFSMEYPNELGGDLGGGVSAEPRDVVLHDAVGGTYSLFFCGGQLPEAIPLSSNIDAIYLESGDAGDLILSLDVPTSLAATNPGASTLLRYTRTGPACGEWSRVGVELEPASLGTWFPQDGNVVGVTKQSGKWLLAVDVPVDPTPNAGPLTYVPGQLISWDGSTFDLFEDLLAAGWEVGSGVAGLSGPATPGLVETGLRLTKSGSVPGDIVLTWSPSCSSGAEDYGIYEGSLGDYTSHASRVCTDTGADLSEELSPDPGDRYYLVVPRNDVDEGSYGSESSGSERVQPVALPERCVAGQTLGTCP